MEQYFDKCIDLIFFDDDGARLGALETPFSGPKPDITIKGTLISISSAISTDITVVNLERDFPIDSVAWIKATMYYGRMNSDNSLSMLFYVNYADQSKGPPDRQVIFRCIQASCCPDLEASRIKIKFTDDKGTPQSKSLSYVLDQFLEAYNSIQEVVMPGRVGLATAISKEIDWAGSSSFKDRELVMGDVNMTVYEFFSYLMEQFQGVEAVGDKVKQLRNYNQLNIYIRNSNTLVVQKNPSYSDPTVTGNKSDIYLSHVISMYRNGPVAHVRSLFDPRISQSSTVHIDSLNMGGRRSLGKIVPLDKSKLVSLYFTPIAGIQFEFGTNQGNYMDMQGVIELEKEVTVASNPGWRLQ